MRHTRALLIVAFLFVATFIAARDAHAAPFSVTSTDNGQALLGALFGSNPIRLSDFTWVFASEEFGGTPITRDLVADNVTFTLDGIAWGSPTLDCASGFDTVAFRVAPCLGGLINNGLGAGTVTPLDAWSQTLAWTAPIEPGLHTLRLRLRDDRDGALDTAVFLQTGTVETVSAVPEPASLVLATGLVGLMGRRRSKAFSR